MGHRRLITYFATHGMGRALRHRDFALYSAFGWISHVGVWAQRIGVFWLVWELTGSGALLGGLALAEVLPLMVLIPVAGAIADRYDRLRVARLLQAFPMGIAALLAVLALFDWISVPALFILVMAGGAGEGLWAPVRLAIAPNLVPEEDFAASVGVNSVLFNTAQFIGPAVAGLIIAFAHIGYIFAFNALSFLSYFIALNFISLTRDERRPRGRADFLAEIKEGVGYLIGHGGIGPMFAILMIASFSIRSFMELLAGVADGGFGRGSEGYAMLASAVGAGGILGGLWVANFAKVRGLTRVVLGAMAASIAIMVVFATSGNFWVVMICCAAMSGLSSMGNMSGQILIQNALSGHMRGRVMSLWPLVYRGAPAMGALIIGALSESWGFQMPFLASSALFLAALIFVLSRRRALAQHLETSS